MRKSLLLILPFIFLSCGEIKKIFEKESPHDRYETMIVETGLAETALGKAWLNAANESLNDTLRIELPYKEQSYFFADEAAAFSYRLYGRRGEKIVVSIDADTLNKFIMFIDIFSFNDEEEIERKTYAEFNQSKLEYEVDENRELIIRIQPELLVGGTFNLLIKSEPSLAFPVMNKSSDDIRSVFGDPRDGGNRDHKGVDIFAPKGTPALAAADGIISRTGSNNLGGKVVWLLSGEKNLYYAHLDSQIVSAGKTVKAGDTLGLVGSSGNARNTPPHLHFGIYIRGEGAVDPFPFIRDIIPAPEDVKVNTGLLGKWGRIKSSSAYVRIAPGANQKIISGLKKNSPFLICGGSGNWFKVKLFTGKTGFIPASKIEPAESAIQNFNVRQIDSIQIKTGNDFAVLYTDEIGSFLPVYGRFENYSLIKFKDRFLWMKE